MPTQKLFDELDSLFPTSFDFDSSLDSDTENETQLTSYASDEDDHRFTRNNSTKSNLTILSSETFATLDTVITSQSTYEVPDYIETKTKTDVLHCSSNNNKSLPVTKILSSDSKNSTRVEGRALQLNTGTHKTTLDPEDKSPAIVIQDLVQSNSKAHRNLHQRDNILHNLLDCINEMALEQEELIKQSLDRTMEEIQNSVPYNTHKIEKFSLKFNER